MFSVLIQDLEKVTPYRRFCCCCSLLVYYTRINLHMPVTLMSKYDAIVVPPRINQNESFSMGKKN